MVSSLGQFELLQVLFSRYVGELRQGRWVDTATFEWTEKSERTRRLLLNALRDQPDYRSHARTELKSIGMNGSAANGSVTVK